MTLILFMLIMAFCIAVFLGAVTQALIEMNGWGFMVFLVLFGYYLWRKHYPRFKYWKVRQENRPTRSARTRKGKVSAEGQVPSLFPWEKEEDEC